MRKISVIFILCNITLFAISQISITPNSGCSGSTFGITITNQTAFGSSSSCVSPTAFPFSNGISQGSCSGYSAVNSNSTSINATLTIDQDATPGVCNFTLTVCGSTFNCNNCFTILPSVNNVSVSPAGNQTLCLGDTIDLNSTATEASSYQWQRNGVDIVGATDSVYAATFSGTYKCAGVNSCGAKLSADSIIINALNPPSVPIITQNGSVLETPFVAALSYQWYKDGQAIQNAFANSVTISGAGSYYVIVDDGSCTSISEAFVVTSIEDINIRFDILPNPASEEVKIISDIPGPYKLDLTDLQGKLVCEYSIENKEAVINVRLLPRGIYILKFRAKDGLASKKLILE
jgi:hypothetical protein